MTALQSRYGLAGDLVNLQGPHDSSQVVAVDTFCCGRIHFAEPRVKRPHAAFLRFAFEGRPYLRVPPLVGEEKAVDQGVDV
ncbi:MAG: hypothetical protein BWY85_02204 [Firmicutes bacterium ADurb.Bin506]|nr:MAG: hypothetical protein BWY85_02204 [Firmicutes bacterium ADurb.Bin506]